MKVALSSYDSDIVKAFIPDSLNLSFYDVALIREIGSHYVGYDLLSTVSDTLANFLNENEDAILCIYCDAATEVRRNNLKISPQEYRSRLFSRMFDRYVAAHNINLYVNHCIKIEIDDNPFNSQFAHFICRKIHEETIKIIGAQLMASDK